MPWRRQAVSDPASTRPRRRRIVSTVASVAALTAALLVAAAPPAQAATGTITGLGGKCVDVSGASTANGAKIQLWTCNGTSAQSWTMGTDGTVRALGKCMDVASGATANGTKVQLWDCNGSSAQQWSYTAAHDLVNPQANKCLDATGQSSADGTALQIWSCTGSANQKWTAPGTSGGGGGGNAAKGAAPYLYLGWGSPPDPRTVMSATGVKWFTMAFILSNGACTPLWDGSRPLAGGNDQTTINNIRAAGGDVAISFGGAAGPWLEQTCTSAGALASAYQQVINAYAVKALDIDIEGPVYNNPTSQQRTIDALKTVRANNPSVSIYVTLPSNQNGPDSSMINRAAASGLTVDAWTIMPFDFGGGGQNMGTLTVQAAEGLKNTLKNGYGYTDDQAYRDAGISSMNGITDVGETVTVANFQTMLAYAQQHHLARFTFWSANRDRPCTGGGADACGGIAQNAWDFTRVIAQYQG